MNEIANTPDAQEMGAFTPDDEQLVSYLGLNPRDPKSRAVVAVCRRYSFDPLLKHVIVIPKGGVYVTRDGLLNAAHRSGQFDGMVVEQDPALDEQSREWVARVSVYRKDMRFPFTYPGRYPADGGNKQYAPEMALKCAEAHALRRAFDITGLPTLDEQKADEARAPRRVAPTPQFSEPEPQVDTDTGEVIDGEAVEDEPGITPQQSKALHATFNDAGIKEREQRLDYCRKLIGRDIESSSDLTAAEASDVIDALKADAEEAT